MSNLSLTDIGYIRSLLGEAGTRTKKELGQNFLTNPSVAPRMAALCGADSTCGVLEIGCGIGVLTVELAKTAGRVVGVEIDRTLIPVLEKTLCGLDNVEIINADIMKTDVSALIREKFDSPVYICANLPYYITTPVIMRLLESGADIASLTLMVQREYAYRLTAKPSTPQYGALTLGVGCRARTEILFDVSSGSFTPRPKVDSCVIRLTPYSEPPVPVKSEKLLKEVIKAAFGKRRKMLRGALAGTADADALARAFEASGIPPTARGETLGLSEFALLADAIFDEKEKLNG